MPNRRKNESGKHLRNQQRAGRWRNNQGKSSRVHKNKRLFKLGADQLCAVLIPTHSQIVEKLNKEKWKKDLYGAELSNARTDDEQCYRGRTEEDNTIQELLKQWESGAHRYVPDSKNNNIVRLACENTNGLSLFHRKATKIRKLTNLIKGHQADGI